MRRHLSPLAPIAAIAAALLATLMTIVAIRGGDPFGVDTSLHDWAVEQRTPTRNDIVKLVTDTGDDIPPTLLAALAGTLALVGLGGQRHRWWLGAIIGIAALLTGQLIRYGLVSALGRPRPPVEDMVRVSTGPAMPSGHTSTSAMVAIGLAAALLLYCHRTATRVLAIAVCAVWAVAVGLSRVYLGSHWPTDVLAGWLFATTVTVLGLPLIATLLRRLSGAPEPADA